MTKAWDGIGTYNKSAESVAFMGTFDGNKKTISGLYFTAGKARGLFNQIAAPAVVKDLTITMAGSNGFVEGASGEYGGAAFVGHSWGGTMENLTAESGTLVGTHNVAGIVCQTSKGSVVKNCTNKMTLKSTYTKISGICAYAQSGAEGADNLVTFENCSNLGNLQQTASYSGNPVQLAGIISYADVPVALKGCSNAKTVTMTALAASNYPQGLQFGQIACGGNASYTSLGGCSGAADKAPIGSSITSTGFAFATVADGVATYVADSEAKAGADLKVMLAGKTVTLAKGESITLDMTIATATVAAADAENDEITKSGNVYTCQAKTVAVTGVALNKTEVTDAKVGDTITLVATVAPENATDKTVTWETTDAAVATVANGVVTILKAGTVTITAKAGEQSATCAITATAAYPAYIGDDTAKQSKYDAWAGLYGADTESANEVAFLLNVAPTEAGDEKAKFVITSITVGADGTVTVVAPEKNSKGAAFNGTVEVLGATALDGEWAPKATGHKFFKAVLK